jgi:hypothetical protein
VNGLSGPTTAVAGGYAHNCALTNAGSVQCWGWNNLGQLGNGETDSGSTPTPITAVTGGIDMISFNAEGGSTVSAQPVVDETATLLPGAPSYPGYAFTGWNTAPDGSGTNYSAGSTYTATGSATLYAQWTFSVTAQPVSHYYVDGQSLTFSAAADATPAPTVQWQYSFNQGATWTNLSGATSTTLTVGPLDAFVNNWEVRAAFTNVPGTTITTDPATMTFTPTYIAYPLDGATVSGEAYNDAIAPYGVSSVLFELSGGTLNHKVIGGGPISWIGWFGGWNTTNVPNGTYTLQSVVISGAHPGIGPGVSITVDNPPPTTAVVLPSNNASVTGNQYLDATASSGVTQVTYEVSGGPANLSDDVIATGTPTLYGWLAAWNTAGVANGSYTLQSVASYAGGVTGTSTPVTITVAN